jgi:hypothetical protein
MAIKPPRDPNPSIQAVLEKLGGGGLPENVKTALDAHREAFEEIESNPRSKKPARRLKRSRQTPSAGRAPARLMS